MTKQIVYIIDSIEFSFELLIIYDVVIINRECAHLDFIY